MAGIFTVKLTPGDKLLGGLRKGSTEYVEVFSRINKFAGEVIAKEVVKRMSAQLRPGHKYQIGASGTAADNLLAKPIKDASGYVQWEVHEGSKTEANAFIRKGIPAGTNVPIPVLRKWAGIRKMSLTRGQNKKARMVHTKGYWRDSKKGVRHFVQDYGRARNNKRTAYQALFAMRQALSNEGTFRPGLMGDHWYERSPYPKNTGRFDYVVFTVRQQEFFQRTVNKASSQAVTAMIDFVTSGRKPLGGTRFISSERGSF